ncbi:MAG TPA: S8 family serine peptidase [Allosphingosinicella sp.]|nr:S8 family serine peptidase [Allosphingosinicella sp.]
MKYFVQMPSAGVAGEAASFLTESRGPQAVARPRTQPDLLIAELDDHDIVVLQDQGAKLWEDVQFAPLPPLEDLGGARVADYALSREDNVPLVDQASLDDVLAHIKAPEAWAYSRGGGATIAIVDTGICASLSQFSSPSPVDLPSAFRGQHWTDVKGHGSMCAVIAAGNKSAGGRFDGVAPDATVISARTTLMSTDLFLIFDELIDLKRQGAIAGPLVISNSYGLYTCTAPAGLPGDHPYLEVVLTAIDEGAFVVFAAGNNHYDVLCNNDPAAASPNTIWGVNSHDRVMSVGTVNRNNSNRDGSTPHANSSRGPGQWASDFPKPDCVAPTYGVVAWGCGYRFMDWWGTSGACPQVAGLGALILARNPRLRPHEVAEIIRRSCVPLQAPRECVGAGLIDCLAAVQLA